MSCCGSTLSRSGSRWEAGVEPGNCGRGPPVAAPTSSEACPHLRSGGDDRAGRQLATALAARVRSRARLPACRRPGDAGLDHVELPLDRAAGLLGTRVARCASAVPAVRCHEQRGHAAPLAGARAAYLSARGQLPRVQRLDAAAVVRASVWTE